MSLNALDRALLAVAPQWALKRIRARAVANVIARNFEAASPGRRTSGWHRSGGDANSAAARFSALHVLREHGRDLERNNGWAKNALRVIPRNTVGWGIIPKATGSEAGSSYATQLFDDWSTQCDADGLLPFYGLQALVDRTVALSGECLVRRRRRRAEDGLPIPLQLQVLEPDFLDTSKDGLLSDTGGPVVQGVEFDKMGRRTAYWLFDQHPGAHRASLNFGGAGSFVSRRVPASEIIHVYDVWRPGQVRGISWLSAAVLNLKDFDEFEDATLMRAKIAACFAAFVTDPEGVPGGLGGPDEKNGDDLVESLEPGMVHYLTPGKTVEFGMPPGLQDDGFSTRALRKVAASMGVTYEDLTGDYSQVNFSSARMGRIAHWGNVEGWRWNMLVPQFCDRAWAWAMEAAEVAGLVPERMRAQWTPPPMPMLEPDKEGLALQRLVRTGALTHDAMARQQGYDPDTHWREYSEGLERLDALGIKLDSDVRAVSQAGLTQERGGAGGGQAASSEATEDAA